jgi:hypothetical protein
VISVVMPLAVASLVAAPAGVRLLRIAAAVVSCVTA